MFQSMIWPFIKSYVRQALMAAGAVLVTKGYLEASQLQEVVGLVVGLIGSFLSAQNAHAQGTAEKALQDVVGAVVTNAPAAETKAAVVAAVAEVPPAVKRRAKKD